MNISPITQNINTREKTFENKKPYKSYLEADSVITTESNIKPLPPQGHLIHDNLGNSIKYFFKDIGYDIKAIKNGFEGTANDHQSGRLNDVGLKLGGIGIATYLASQTSNPRARLMEYIGLGTFLATMQLYPKIAINLPAKLRHGFDIDKQYIDDQGRKKSVMQDNNYVPYDMYLGKIPNEDLAIIGDRMGIPRDEKNREELIKAQMRKIATQNNTLWMLTAGFATPTITALICCGLENYVVSPALEKARNKKFNEQIKNLLSKTKEMKVDTNSLKENELSKNVEKILSSYKGKEIPKEEVDKILSLLTKHLDENISEALRNDVRNLLNTSANEGVPSFLINNESIESIINVSKKAIGKRNKETLEQLFVPSKQEIETILNSFITKGSITDGAALDADTIREIKKEFRKLFDKKLADSKSTINKQYLESVRDTIINNISLSLKSKESKFVSETSINEVINLAKILGDFKEIQKALAKCKSFKFEHAPETVLAQSYAKFEKTLLNELGFSYKELKKMKESGDFSKEILDKKLTELCKDEQKYSKIITKLGNVITEMEAKLHGQNIQESCVKDLITAIENNYNKTAGRLNSLNGEKFKSIIKALVQDDVERLGTSIESRGHLFDVLDGVSGNRFTTNLEEYIRLNAAGKGSSKYAEVSRIYERYQGVINSFNRILHTLDVYKRSLNPETFSEVLNGKSIEYKNTIIQKGKDALLSAKSADHTLKLDLINNPFFYRDLMNSIWEYEKDSVHGLKRKGHVTTATQNALNATNGAKEFNLLTRFQQYIARFNDIIANSNIDFTKPHHRTDNTIRNLYASSERTNIAFFNLIGQTPTEMIKGGANKKYNTQKWIRTVSAIVGSVFSVAILAQLSFSKANASKKTVQKQVKNEQN